MLNPIWTADSVGVRGFDGGKPLWVSVGTNRREELVTALEQAVPDARTRTPAWVTTSAPSVAPPGWHPDPWDPADSAGGVARGADQSGRLRWWDGTQWTGWTHPRPRGPSGVGGSGP
jgi:hypothetical protein